MQFAEPEWLDRVTSTNTVLLARIEAGTVPAHGTVLAANEQTAGRGRGRHQWQAQPGRDLCFSFVCHTHAPPRQLASLAMATALGIVDCLQGFDIVGQTKWPNDVLVADATAGASATGPAKIAGILCELRPGVAIVGVGLNVSMSATEAGAIDQAATSILIQTGTVMAPQDVLPRLLTALSPRLQTWQDQGFAGLHSAWTRRCLAVGEQIIIDDGDTQRQGLLVGFGDAGQLLLRASDQDDQTPPIEVWSGHLRLVQGSGGAQRGQAGT